jgi:hypothetical protein
MELFRNSGTPCMVQNVFLKAKTQKAILCELTEMSLKRNNSFDCKNFGTIFRVFLGR